jgi:hypothetical protein
MINRITILNVTEGSTKVELELSAGDDEEANAAAEAISSGVGDGVAGFEVLESTVAVYFDGEEFLPGDDNKEEEEMNNVALIAGLSAGGTVLLVLITAYVCYKSKSKSTQVGDDHSLDAFHVAQGKDQSYDLANIVETEN